MSDPKIKELEDKLIAKQGAINEFLRELQSKDREVRVLVEQRKKLDDKVELLEKRLRRAELHAMDAAQSRDLLAQGLELYVRAYHDASDSMDEIDAALEIHDPQSTIRKVVDDFRTKTAQARNYASSDYARRAQERLLLAVWKKGELTQELREELGRFMESHKETMTDADNRAEIDEILTRSDGSR